MCVVALDFLNGGSLPSIVNFTYITLIPKVQNPVSVNEFRPLSLYIILYIIIAKALSNKLKKVLFSVISPNQSVFILSRLISNNIKVTYESLHSMKTRKKWKVGNMALKPDISKVYDRVKWSFLKKIIEKMRFE